MIARTAAVVLAASLLAVPALAQKPKPDTKERVTVLLGELKSSNAGVRAKAADGLGALGPDAEAAIPALAGLLRDSNPSVRLSVSLALAKLGPKAVKPVIDLLADKVEDVQIFALQTLAEFGPTAKDAVAAVDKLLRAKSPHVVLNAALALGAIGKEAVLTLSKSLADKNEDVRYHAAFALGLIGRDAAEAKPALLKCVDDRNPGMRRKVTYALARIGPDDKEIKPTLAKALADRDSDVRESLMETLVKMGAPSLPVFLEVLQGKDPAARLLAVKALGELGADAAPAAPSLVGLLKDSALSNQAYQALIDLGKHAVPALLDGLKDSDNNRRSVLIDILGRIGPAAGDAIPILTADLQSSNLFVRRSATRALGQIAQDDPTMPQRLVERLTDDDYLTRREAAQALGAIRRDPERSVPALVKSLGDADEAVSVYATGALARFGVDALPALTKAVREETSRTRLYALRAIYQIGELARSTLPTVVEALSDKNDDIRFQVMAIVASLAQRGDEKLVPAIVAGLKDSYIGTQREAAQAIAVLPVHNEATFKALVEAADDPDIQVREYVAGPLSWRVQGQGLAAVMRLLQHRRPEVRRHALIRLQHWIRDEVQPQAPLFYPLVTDPDRNVRHQAIESIRHMGRAGKLGVPLVVRRLDDPEKMVRDHACYFLDSLDEFSDMPSNTVPSLLAALKSQYPDSRRYAVVVLGRMGKYAKSAIPAVKDMEARESDEQARQAAQWALKNLGKE